MTPTQLGTLCSFLASVTWALGVSTYSRLSLKYKPGMINFTRAAVAFPAFCLLALATNASWHVEALPLAYFTLSMFMTYILGDVVFMWSAQRLGVPSALAIASTYPLLATLAVGFTTGVWLTARQALGLLGVVVGVVLVILSAERGEGNVKSKPKSEVAKGIGLALLASVMWATNAFAVSRAGTSTSPFTANAVRMGIALVFCPVFSVLTRQTGAMFLSRADFRLALGVFLLEGIGGTFAFTYGLSHAPLAVGAALSSLAPVLSLPIALYTRQERFSRMKTVGIVLVVTGVVLLVRA